MSDPNDIYPEPENLDSLRQQKNPASEPVQQPAPQKEPEFIKPKKSFNIRWWAMRIVPIFLVLVLAGGVAFATVPAFRQVVNKAATKLGFNIRADEIDNSSLQSSNILAADIRLELDSLAINNIFINQRGGMGTGGSYYSARSLGGCEIAIDNQKPVTINGQASGYGYSGSCLKMDNNNNGLLDHVDAQGKIIWLSDLSKNQVKMNLGPGRDSSVDQQAQETKVEAHDNEGAGIKIALGFDANNTPASAVRMNTLREDMQYYKQFLPYKDKPSNDILANAQFIMDTLHDSSMLKSIAITRKPSGAEKSYVAINDGPDYIGQFDHGACPDNNCPVIHFVPTKAGNYTLTATFFTGAQVSMFINVLTIDSKVYLTAFNGETNGENVNKEIPDNGELKVKPLQYSAVQIKTNVSVGDGDQAKTENFNTFYNANYIYGQQTELNLNGAITSGDNHNCSTGSEAGTSVCNITEAITAASSATEKKFHKYDFENNSLVKFFFDAAPAKFTLKFLGTPEDSKATKTINIIAEEEEDPISDNQCVSTTNLDNKDLYPAIQQPATSINKSNSNLLTDFANNFIFKAKAVDANTTNIEQTSACVQLSDKKEQNLTLKIPYDISKNDSYLMLHSNFKKPAGSTISSGKITIKTNVKVQMSSGGDDSDISTPLIINSDARYRNNISVSDDAITYTFQDNDFAETDILSLPVYFYANSKYLKDHLDQADIEATFTISSEYVYKNDKGVEQPKKNSPEHQITTFGIPLNEPKVTIASIDGKPYYKEGTTEVDPDVKAKPGSLVEYKVDYMPFDKDNPLKQFDLGVTVPDFVDKDKVIDPNNNLNLSKYDSNKGLVYVPINTANMSNYDGGTISARFKVPYSSNIPFENTDKTPLHTINVKAFIRTPNSEKAVKSNAVKTDIWQTITGKITGPYGHEVPGVTVALATEKENPGDLNDKDIGGDVIVAGADVHIVSDPENVLISNEKGIYEIPFNRAKLDKKNNIKVLVFFRNVLSAIKINNLDTALLKSWFIGTDNSLLYWKTEPLNLGNLSLKDNKLQQNIDISRQNGQDGSFASNPKPEYPSSSPTSDLGIFKQTVMSAENQYWLYNAFDKVKQYSEGKSDLQIKYDSENHANWAAYQKDVVNEPSVIVIAKSGWQIINKYEPHIILHEFSHFIHFNLLNFKQTDVKIAPHAGYSNPTSQDSFMEGFANFMAVYFYNAISGKGGNFDAQFYSFDGQFYASYMSILPVYWSAWQIGVYNNVDNKAGFDREVTVFANFLRRLVIGSKETIKRENVIYPWLNPHHKFEFNIDYYKYPSAQDAIDNNVMALLEKMQNSKPENISDLYYQLKNDPQYNQGFNEIGLNNIEQQAVANGIFVDDGNWKFDFDANNPKVHDAIGSPANNAGFWGDIYQDNVHNTIWVNPRPGRKSTIIPNTAVNLTILGNGGKTAKNKDIDQKTKYNTYAIGIIDNKTGQIANFDGQEAKQTIDLNDNSTIYLPSDLSGDYSFFINAENSPSYRIFNASDISRLQNENASFSYVANMDFNTIGGCDKLAEDQQKQYNDKKKELEDQKLPQEEIDKQLADLKTQQDNEMKGCKETESQAPMTVDQILEINKTQNPAPAPAVESDAAKACDNLVDSNWNEYNAKVAAGATQDELNALRESETAKELACYTKVQQDEAKTQLQADTAAQDAVDASIDSQVDANNQPLVNDQMQASRDQYENNNDQTLASQLNDPEYQKYSQAQIDKATDLINKINNLQGDMQKEIEASDKQFMSDHADLIFKTPGFDFSWQTEPPKEWPEELRTLASQHEKDNETIFQKYNSLYLDYSSQLDAIRNGLDKAYLTLIGDKLSQAYSYLAGLTNISWLKEQAAPSPDQSQITIAGNNFIPPPPPPPELMSGDLQGVRDGQVNTFVGDMQNKANLQDQILLLNEARDLINKRMDKTITADELTRLAAIKDQVQPFEKEIRDQLGTNNPDSLNVLDALIKDTDLPRGPIANFGESINNTYDNVANFVDDHIVQPVQNFFTPPPPPMQAPNTLNPTNDPLVNQALTENNMSGQDQALINMLNESRDLIYKKQDNTITADEATRLNDIRNFFQPLEEDIKAKLGPGNQDLLDTLNALLHGQILEKKTIFQPVIEGMVNAYQEVGGFFEEHILNPIQDIFSTNNTQSWLRFINTAKAADSVSIYITRQQDKADIANATTSFRPGEIMVVNASGFDKSKNVQVFIDNTFIENAKIISGKFGLNVQVPVDAINGNHTIKLVGDAKGEFVTKDISVTRAKKSYQQYYWIIPAVLALFGLGYYFLRRRKNSVV